MQNIKIKNSIEYNGETYDGRSCSGRRALARDFAKRNMDDLVGKGLLTWYELALKYGADSIAGIAAEFLDNVAGMTHGILFYGGRTFFFDNPDLNEDIFYELAGLLARKIAEWLAIYEVRMQRDMYGAVLYNASRLVEVIFGLPEKAATATDNAACLKFDGDKFRINPGDEENFGLQKLANCMAFGIAYIAEDVIYNRDGLDMLSDNSRLIKYRAQELLYKFLKDNFGKRASESGEE